MGFLELENATEHTEFVWIPSYQSMCRVVNYDGGVPESVDALQHCHWWQFSSGNATYQTNISQIFIKLIRQELIQDILDLAELVL